MLAHEANTKIWYPAIYGRLSDEDRENKVNGVSLSIDHQIDILKKFVKDKDNRTGTDFNRKGFQAMYAEAQNGNINVIVIKDTSRFGRNWVKSGDYFEKIEEMGVRFISIQEGIDTIDPKCPGLKMLPFYFIFNEWHSQTTSEKIRTVLANDAKIGKYRTTYAPYGFRKDPDDKHKLIIDPYAAGVVKWIYEMRLQKLSYGAIVETLNAKGILSPSAYSVEVNGKATTVPSRQGKWNKDSLNIMFQNPAYRGDTANGKKTAVSYKNHTRVRQPMSKWIIVENTHEPIVSREDWQNCYDMIQSLGRVRRTKESEVLPLTGLLVCPDCDYKMRHNHSYYTLKSGEKRRHDGYNCASYSSQGKTACTNHYISEKDLISLVCEDIRQSAGKVVQDENAARERFYAIKAQASGTKINADRSALKKVNKRFAELDKLLQAAFEKSVLGGASSELFTEYARKYETEKQELMKQAKQLSASIEQQSKTESDVETFIALMKKHVNITELDRATAVELIDHITISASTVKPREIVIYYNFMGNVEQ